MKNINDWEEEFDKYFFLKYRNGKRKTRLSRPVEDIKNFIRKVLDNKLDTEMVQSDPLCVLIKLPFPLCIIWGWYIDL